MRYKAGAMRLPRPSRALFLPVAGGLLLARGVAWAASDPAVPDLGPILLALVLILVGARLGGSLLERLGQPAVLGELVAGIVLGNLGLVGLHGFDPLRTTAGRSTCWPSSGVLILLFEVGLESNVDEMLQGGRVVVRWSAMLGVIAPIVLGWGTSRLLLPEPRPATCTASSARRCPPPASASPRGCSRTSDAQQRARRASSSARR